MTGPLCAVLFHAYAGRAGLRSEIIYRSESSTGGNTNMMDERTILLVLPILVLQIALMIFALVDLVRNPNPNGPKWMWAAIIVLLNLIGPILYFVIGRRNY